MLAIAATIPIAIPTTVNLPTSPSTIPSTRVRAAPSASLRPISVRRLATRYDRVP